MHIYHDIKLTVTFARQTYVTLFWKTIHLGTLANFVFYSYNEALSGYLSTLYENFVTIR